MGATARPALLRQRAPSGRVLRARPERGGFAGPGAVRALGCSRRARPGQGWQQRPACGGLALGLERRGCLTAGLPAHHAMRNKRGRHAAPHALECTCMGAGVGEHCGYGSPCTDVWAGATLTLALWTPAVCAAVQGGGPAAAPDLPGALHERGGGGARRARAQRRLHQERARQPARAALARRARAAVRRGPAGVARRPGGRWRGERARRPARAGAERGARRGAALQALRAALARLWEHARRSARAGLARRARCWAALQAPRAAPGEGSTKSLLCLVCMLPRLPWLKSSGTLQVFGPAPFALGCPVMGRTTCEQDACRSGHVCKERTSESDEHAWTDSYE